MTIQPSLTLELILSHFQMTREQFYLTGSRFFGTATEASDYDFYTSKHGYGEAIVKELGFKEISTELMVDHGYDFNQFAAVYELITSDGKKVQVQIVENVAAKACAQARIKNRFLTQFNAMGKEDRKEFWSFVLDLIG